MPVSPGTSILHMSPMRMVLGRSGKAMELATMLARLRRLWRCR